MVLRHGSRGTTTRPAPDALKVDYVSAPQAVHKPETSRQALPVSSWALRNDLNGASGP